MENLINEVLITDLTNIVLDYYWQIYTPQKINMLVEFAKLSASVVAFKMGTKLLPSNILEATTLILYKYVRYSIRMCRDKDLLRAHEESLKNARRTRNLTAIREIQFKRFVKEREQRMKNWQIKLGKVL